MADLILRDVRLVAAETGTPSALGPQEPTDVLVTDGTVSAIGTGLARPAGVEEIDGAGRWLIPGLWDQHVHLGQWTLSRQRLDTRAVHSPEEAVALVAARVAADPGRPIIGLGHRPGAWSREVTVAELDAVSGVTPVVLVAGDCHHGWLNSAALAALGLGARDDVVRENEWFAAYDLLTTLTATDGTDGTDGADGTGGSDGDGPGAYRASLLDAAARGVVGLVDFEFAGGTAEWVERWQAGCDLLRVRVATYADRLEEVIAAGRRTGDPLVAGEARLTMGPLKIISDGSLNTRTAWCCEPYADADRLTLPSGAANLPLHQLQAQLARAHTNGLHVATHAIGDAAVAAALDAFATTGARGSVEHAQLIHADDVGRIAQLGLRASVQPAHLLDDRDLTELIWPGRGGRSFAFRWMREAGVRLVLGSDAPVSPLDPWLAMAAAVHRSADARAAWHPEQALSAREALAASVDEQPLPVAAGSRGDLVLLDADPLAPLTPAGDGGDGGGGGAGGDTDGDGGARRTSAALLAIGARPVALTVVAGRVVHSTL